MDNYLRIFMKGGIISPGQLKKLLTIAKSVDNTCLHFGSRQDILFRVPYDFSKVCNDLHNQGFVYERKDGPFENITSSYIAADLFPGTSWVKASAFLYILESLPAKSLLKIGVFDPKQKLVPLFFNNINIGASSIANYWHISLRLKENDFQLQHWPVLVFQDDIAAIVEQLEILYLQGMFEVNDLFAAVNKDHQYSNRNSTEQMYLPDVLEADIEGFELMPGGKKYRLGLYWRNNDYWIHFLNSMCDLCIRTYVGRICLSPWKSLMIKDIELHHRNIWEGMLGNFGINTRHSGFELNWHIPFADTYALNLKKYLIKEIDRRDIRTSGLTFTIGNSAHLLFTSVVIRKRPLFSIMHREFFNTYDVLVAKDFNPNTMVYTQYASKVMQKFLPEIIRQISISFFAKQSLWAEQLPAPKQGANTTEEHEIWQCQTCLSVYDREYGDVVANIVKGVRFEDLPSDYVCSTCGEGKQLFVKKNISVTINTVAP